MLLLRNWAEVGSGRRVSEPADSNRGAPARYRDMPSWPDLPAAPRPAPPHVSGRGDAGAWQVSSSGARSAAYLSGPRPGSPRRTGYVLGVALPHGMDVVYSFGVWLYEQSVTPGLV